MKARLSARRRSSPRSCDHRGEHRRCRLGGEQARPPSASPAPRPRAPGSESYFDLARKDCVGTARNTTSKVWFTVADGVLSDTYWPTVDATNVHTLQYIVTGISGGKSFTDLQTRDMTYKVLPDPTGMSCTVVASPSPSIAAHGYQITTTYIADPARDAVLMRTDFKGPIRRSPVRAPRSARRRHRWRRRAERRREHRAHRRRQPQHPGGVQHEHDHRRGQPRLRGPDVHGARILERLLERRASATRTRPATA